MESVSSSSEKEGASASYTYWVRKVTEDAAPLPVPLKLNPQDPQSHSSTLGSAWNRVSVTFTFFFIPFLLFIFYLYSLNLNECRLGLGRRKVSTIGQLQELRFLFHFMYLSLFCQPCILFSSINL